MSHQSYLLALYFIDSASPSPSSVPSKSSIPSNEPSIKPSISPSSQPSDEPSIKPSTSPSTIPSDQPSIMPSDQPSESPSSLPSFAPSIIPSNEVCHERTRYHYYFVSVKPTPVSFFLLFISHQCYLALSLPHLRVMNQVLSHQRIHLHW